MPEITNRWTGPHLPAKQVLAFALVISGLLGLLRLFTNPPELEDDQTNNWWPAALALHDGAGYTECLPQYFPFCGPENNATAMREPLPVLLFAGVAWLGRSLYLAACFQVLLQMCIVYAVFLLARELGGTRNGLIAALIWAIYLPSIQVLSHISGDMVATLAVVLGARLFARAAIYGNKWHWLQAGLFLGAATLSRSALMVMAIPLGIGALVQGWRQGGPGWSRLRPAVFFGAAWIVVLAPWWVRNYAVFGEPVIGSTLTGYNLLRHNDQLRADVPFHYANAEEGEVVTTTALVRHPELTGKENEAQVDRVYRAEGLSVIRAHPARYLGLCAYRALPLWFNWKVNDSYGKPSGLMDHTMMVMQAMLLVLALIGIRSLDKRALPLLYGAVLLCLAYLAVVARMRYTLPIMPIVVVVAALGIERWRVGFSRKKSA